MEDSYANPHWFGVASVHVLLFVVVESFLVDEFSKIFSCMVI